MKKKVLMVCTLPPPVHGSAMVSQFIKDSKLINDEFDMDFVNLSTSRKMEEIGKSSPILLFKKLGRFVSAYISCFWLLLTNKYDLCYCAITCHGKGFQKDAPFVLLCKLFRRKIVIHQHNKGMSKCVDRNPYRWLLPLVYRNTKVMLLSWHLYDDISKVVSRDQVLICPNGIPEITDNVDNIERNNPVPKLLFLSNLIESKGVFVLLDACRILKDKGYQFICDFVGGETKEITREIFEDEVRKRCLDDEISYKGRKYGEEKEMILNSCDIFTFPTHYENECFPLVILEALQHKMVVATTSEGGIRDIVEHMNNGLISKSRDAEDLANNIAILLKDENLRNVMGEKGYQLYKEKFTLDIFENKFKQCINKCL